MGDMAGQGDGSIMRVSVRHDGYGADFFPKPDGSLDDFFLILFQGGDENKFASV